MAYSALDVTKPVIANTRADIVDRTRINDAALRDALVLGGDGSLTWAYAQTDGADAYHPTAVTLTNGAQRERWELTWDGHKCTGIIYKYSSNSGSTYDTVGTVSFGYTGTTVTSGNVGSMAMARIFALHAYAHTLGSAVTAHTDATGPAVHGLGTMAVQPAAAVSITGGAINSTSVGVSTPAEGRFTRACEGFNTYSGLTLNQAVALDWTNGGSALTMNGSHTLTFSNVPSSRIATHFLYVNGNFNNITWPAAVNWGLAGRPSIAGNAAIQLVTFDGGSSYMAGAFWRAA